jgi:hypothetical protein
MLVFITLLVYNLPAAVTNGIISDGRVPAPQAGCCGFESRLPLHRYKVAGLVAIMDGGEWRLKKHTEQLPS